MRVEFLSPDSVVEPRLWVSTMEVFWRSGVSLLLGPGRDKDRDRKRVSLPMSFVPFGWGEQPI